MRVETKKHIVNLISRLKGHSFDEQYDQIKNLVHEMGLWNAHFQKLLMHAYKNVSFYSQRLEGIKAIKDNAIFSEFMKLPLLVRTDIRNYMKELTSRDIAKRKWYHNLSSGSMGEPIRFIQDESDSRWRNATLRYYYENMLDIDELAVKKTVLWVSPRDLNYTNLGFRAKLNLWLYNTKSLNCYIMSEKDIEYYVKIINSHKPEIIRGFAGVLFELCKFIEKKGMSIHQPKIVVSTAEKLRRFMREKIEDVFGVKVYDYYGSREIHGVAGECNAGLLHIFMFNNYIEVLDERNNPVRNGELGKVVVTTLHNYSMPFIRYEIGDMAILGPKRCKCGNSLPTLKEVTGRTFDYFIKENGSLIHGDLFVQILRRREWIKAFQIIQEDHRKIRILTVLNGDINEKEKRDDEKKILIVMGSNCDVIWEFVNEIPRNRSGKRIYAKSLLYQ